MTASMDHAANHRPPAVILDLDGTLADSLNDIRNAVNHALALVTRDGLDRDTVRGMVGDGLVTLMSRAADTDDPTTVQALVERFRGHYSAHFLTHTRLYDGAERFFDHCERENVARAVLSNKPHEYTVMICDRLLAPWTVSAVIGAGNGRPVKPDPTAALSLTEALGRPPSETLLAGDSVVDIETARAAGMRAVAVTWGFQDRGRLRAAGPDHLVDTFEELWDVVRNHWGPGAN